MDEDAPRRTTKTAIVKLFIPFMGKVFSLGFFCFSASSNSYDEERHINAAHEISTIRSKVGIVQFVAAAALHKGVCFCAVYVRSCAFVL